MMILVAELSLDRYSQHSW